MPFGWGASPWWAHKLAYPVRQKMQEAKIPHCWFVDDLLILGTNPEEVSSHTLWTINLLTKLGLKVNTIKSMQHPQQSFTYLGHQINLASNQLHSLPTKTMGATKLTKKMCKSNVCQPQSLASLAGTILDLAVSNSTLRGCPQQLMSKAGQMVTANARRFHLPPHKYRNWTASSPKPPGLKELLKTILKCLQNPKPVTFRGNLESNHWRLTTDASEEGWGATLERRDQSNCWKEVQTMQNIWTTEESKVHITKLEALATNKASKIIMTTINHGDHLHVRTDASSTLLGMEERHQEPKNQLHRPRSLATIPRTRSAHHCRPHPRAAEHQGRLVIPGARPQKLSIGQKSVSPCLPPFPFSTTSVSFCQPSQCSTEIVLFLAPRWTPQQPWQRLGHTLDQTSMVEPPLGIDLEH